MRDVPVSSQCYLLHLDNKQDLFISSYQTRSDIFAKNNKIAV